MGGLGARGWAQLQFKCCSGLQGFDWLDSRHRQSFSGHRVKFMRISGRQLCETGGYRLLLHLPLALALFAARLSAQAGSVPSAARGLPEFPDPASLDQPSHPEGPQPHQSGTASAAGNQEQSTTKPQGIPIASPQSQRILGIIPNFHAVSPGEKPPPPTPNRTSLSPPGTVLTTRRLSSRAFPLSRQKELIRTRNSAKACPASAGITGAGSSIRWMATTWSTLPCPPFSIRTSVITPWAGAAC